MPRKKFINMKKIRGIQLVDSMNSWVGSWVFLFVHIIWFMLWLTQRWDINVLTMIVSLEAIILMIILLMAQNRQSMVDNLRDEADLQADLQAVDLGNQILKEIKDLRKEIKDLKK